jgi:hypothetical protein
MILPSKHLPQKRALLTVGAEILRHLTVPITISALWEQMRCDVGEQKESLCIHYAGFVLALDLLFLMGAIELHDGLIVRRTS